jgi:hypothetical protein
MNIIQSRFMRYSLTLLALAAGLSACGGGGSGVTGSASGVPVQAAAAGTTSSGVITAFGSVFVGGHEFDTRSAQFIDDDSGAVSNSATGLEVGMVVDVKPARGSSARAPVASELHIHPLARGYVDAVDTTAGTLQVMGQTVQLTSSTNFSDHRACVSATTSPCTAVTTPAGLSATTGPTAPGSYVAVHGYLYNAGATNIVATLVSVADVPTATTGVNFKAEGAVTAVGSSSVTIGGLTVDLSSATCRVSGTTTPCTAAFSTGQVVAAGAAVAPTLPATTFVAGFARLASKISVDTAGSAVEVEGVVSSTGTSSFVVRGVTVDTSTLTTTLPAVGDVVRVLGTVSGTGQTVTVSATSVVVLHAASSVKVGLEGDATAITAGSAANTFTLSVLGQTVTVNDKTRLIDMSVRGWDRRDPAGNPFNITTFATYMAASASSHVIAKTETDSSGNLVANSLAIVPASNFAGVAGLVDATPPVVNSTVATTPSTLSVHGIAIEVAPAAVIVHGHNASGFNTIAAGDQVVALGTWSNGVLSIGATVTPRNQLFDAGAPREGHMDRGEF